MAHRRAERWRGLAEFPPTIASSSLRNRAVGHPCPGNFKREVLKLNVCLVAKRQAGRLFTLAPSVQSRAASRLHELLSASTVTRIAANMPIGRKKRQRQTLRRQCWQVNSAAEYAAAWWQLSAPLLQPSAPPGGRSPHRQALSRVTLPPAEPGAESSHDALLQPSERLARVDLPAVGKAGSGGSKHFDLPRRERDPLVRERRWNQLSADARDQLG
jgi:hypothetical protein